MRLSIRLKFLIVMSGLLLVCLSFYLLMSVTVFKSDKTQLVYDLNKSQVTNLASEIETNLKGVSDSLQLFAQLPKNLQLRMIENLFSGNSDIVGLTVAKSKTGRLNSNFNSKEFFETYGLEKGSFFEKQRIKTDLFEKIQKEGTAIWNASVDGAPPLIGFGKRVLVLDAQGTPVEQWVLVSYLKIDSLLKSVSLLNLSEIQVSNAEGEVLVQREAKGLLNKPNIKNSPLFQSALKSQVRISVTHVKEESGGWLSAFARTFNDQLFVTARVPEKKVFQVVKSLTVRTFLFGSIVLTLVILAAFLLSKSLTENIAILSRRMVSVSKGDLETNIQLKGQDETVSLARAFNKMIYDLKQSRDALEIMNKELDQKVKDRTRELEIQNQKVAEAQEALLRTTRLASMGEVAGRTAHEVLNPLTSLLTRVGLAEKRVEANYSQSLELLQEINQAWIEDYDQGGFENLLASWKEPSQIDPAKNLFVEDVENLSKIRESLVSQSAEIAKDMQFIKAEGDRIGKIIHGMRRLGNTNSEVKQQSIHSLLDDCCYIMADLFDQQRIKISKEYNAEFDSVAVDRDEFIQSVTNLMRNSLQSMIEVKKSDIVFPAVLKLRTKIENKNIIVEIEDNGLGIEADHKEKLFSTNFTTKSSDEGTGLGLSISRRFIRNHDGDITFVSSVKKEKTLFRIQLPIVSDGQGKAVA